MSSVDGSSDAGTCSSSINMKASVGLAKNFLCAKERQAQEILEEIGDDLELQLVVKECITNYKKEKGAAADMGLSIRDIVKNTVVSRKRKADDNASDDD